MWEVILAALTSAASVAAVTAIIQAVVGRRKMSADTARIIEEAAGSAVKRSEEEIKRLGERVKTAENTIASMEKQMSEMKSQMEAKDERVEHLEEQVRDLTEDRIVLVEHVNELRAVILHLDPSAVLPPLPPRVINHFHPQPERKTRPQEF